MNMIKDGAKLMIGKGTVRSYSQFGEDAVLHSILRSVKNGVYVDVGAYHPTLYSNTYLFYRKGWNGLAIDPNPDMAPLFKAFRPRDTFACAAIGEGVLTYYRYADGAYNTLDPKQVEKMSNEKGVHPASTQEVLAWQLGDLVKHHGIARIDLLNVDVEGLDLEVLRSHDWEIRPRVIAVEDHTFEAGDPSTSAIWQYLTGRGYKLVGKAGLTLIFT